MVSPQYQHSYQLNYQLILLNAYSLLPCYQSQLIFQHIILHSQSNYYNSYQLHDSHCFQLIQMFHHSPYNLNKCFSIISLHSKTFSCNTINLATILASPSYVFFKLLKPIKTSQYVL